MYHSFIKPFLFRAKRDILMRAKWDNPVVPRYDTCLMTNASFKYVNNGYTP